MGAVLRFLQMWGQVSALEPPNLSEVIRRLDELRQDLKAFGGRFVSTEIYMLDKQVYDREAKERNDRITGVEKEIAANDKLRTQEREAKDQKIQDQAATNRKFLIGIVISPFASAAIAWILTGGMTR